MSTPSDDIITPSISDDLYFNEDYLGLGDNDKDSIGRKMDRVIKQYRDQNKKVLAIIVVIAIILIIILITLTITLWNSTTVNKFLVIFAGSIGYIVASGIAYFVLRKSKIEYKDVELNKNK